MGQKPGKEAVVVAAAAAAQQQQQQPDLRASASGAASDRTPVESSEEEAIPLAAGASLSRSGSTPTVPRAVGAAASVDVGPKAGSPLRKSPSKSSSEDSEEKLGAHTPTRVGSRGSFSLRGTFRKSKKEAGSKKRGTARGGQKSAGPGAGAEAAEFSKKRAEELFEHYKAVAEDPDDVDDLEQSGESDAIGPNGISALLSDLGFHEDDVIGFVVAWKLGCKQLGRITRDEFVSGLTALKCDSVAAIKSIVPRLQGELKSKDTARDVFCYAWTISKPLSAKTLDLESAKFLLELFLPPDCFGHTGPFVDWILNHQTSYRAVSKDQWDNLYDFSLMVSPDLGNYDEDDGWPCLLDEYVQWRRNPTADGC